jgi:hypothetical protein
VHATACWCIGSYAPVYNIFASQGLRSTLHKNYGSATAERSFSVLRRLKTYVRSTMNNDRLSSLALIHIHRDFSVDLDKVKEKFVSAKTRRTDFGQF